MWHDECSVFPAVNELCQSELSTLPLSSIKSLNTSIKHRKKMPLRTFHHKRTWCTNAGSHSYLHTCTRMQTLIFITHHTTAQIFMGPRLVSGISAHVMFVIENIIFYNSQTLQSATVHFRTVVKSSYTLSQLLILEHIVEDNVSIVIFSCWSLNFNIY